MIYDIWYTRCEVWYVRYEIRYLRSEVWYMRFEVRYMRFDVWDMIYDVIYYIYYMRYDIRDIIYEMWWMRYGIWFMIYDMWDMIYEIYDTWYVTWDEIHEIWYTIYEIRYFLFTACSITDSNTTCLERSSYTFYIIYVCILLYAYIYGCLCLVWFSWLIAEFEMFWFISSFLCFMVLHCLWLNSMCLHITIGYIIS